MDNFTFYSPTYFAFGKGTENETGKYVKKYGGHKVLIHYGGGSVKHTGLLYRVKASLDAEGIAYVELGGVKASPHADLVYEGIDLAKKEGVDFVLAIGGGSVMYSAKGIALGVKHDGDILRPLFAIMNPELMMTLPPYQTASGLADIFAHCLERYFSHTKDCELTDCMLEAVMLTIIKEGRRVMKNPNDYEARANIMWAAMVAQNNSTGVGRAQDWGTHHMDNEIGILYGASHGAGLALLFPYWMEYAMKVNGPELFVKFATRVFGCQNDFEHPEATAMEGIRCVRQFMNDLNMPATISELGGKEEDIPVMVENMFHGAPNHGNFVKLTPEIAAEIYRMAL